MPDRSAPQDDFAAVLKRARLAAKRSQTELAEASGLTGSYVCLLESRRRPPPTPEVVAALANALEVEAGPWQELAALERTPEPVRRRVVRLVRERTRFRRTRDRLLATTLFHVLRRPGFAPDHAAEALGLPDDHRIVLTRLAARLRDVPTARGAEARAPELLREVKGRDRDALVRALPRLLSGSALPAQAPLLAPAPAPQPAEERPWRVVPVLEAPPPRGGTSVEARDRFHLDRRLWRPGCYVLVAADDEAYPRVERGDWLLVHPDEIPGEGALVVWLEGAHVRLRTVRRQADHVRLDSSRADAPPIRVPTERFAPAGVVGWIFRPLDGLPTPRT